MPDKGRCKLLKSIVAGSGVIVAGKSLPENWSKPVVDSVLLPAHAQATTPCTSCLDSATYCAGSGESSITVTVALNGTVTVVHNRGTGTDTVDPCTGGTFEVIYSASGNLSQITVSGSIPCGVVDSIVVTETDGSNPPDTRAYDKNCT